MALHRFNLSNRPTATVVAAQGTDGTTAAKATLAAAVAAAQLIGAGDASAEIDAIDAAAVALTDPTTPGEMIVLIDTTAFTTRTQIRQALDRFMDKLANYPGLFTP